MFQCCLRLAGKIGGPTTAYQVNTIVLNRLYLISNKMYCMFLYITYRPFLCTKFLTTLLNIFMIFFFHKMVPNTSPNVPTCRPVFNILVIHLNNNENLLDGHEQQWIIIIKVHLEHSNVYMLIYIYINNICIYSKINSLTKSPF